MIKFSIIFESSLTFQLPDSDWEPWVCPLASDINNLNDTEKKN